MILFDITKRQKNQLRALKHFTHHDFLLKHTASIINEKLEVFGGSFENILEIDARYGHLTQILSGLYPKARCIIHRLAELPTDLYPLRSNFTYIEGDYSKLGQEFDLIVSSCSLHWAENPILEFKKLHALLSSRGILICSFIGGRSLVYLRHLLANVELATSAGTAMHIIPMIRFDDVPKLVKQSGFENYVLDIESIEVNYSSYKQLVADLRYMGEGAAFSGKSNYSFNKEALLKLKESSHFTEEFELITIIASKVRDGFKGRIAETV